MGRGGNPRPHKLCSAIGPFPAVAPCSCRQKPAVLVRSHIGLVGYRSFFVLPPPRITSVNKYSGPSAVGILSYSLGHCGHSYCVSVLESSDVKTEVCSVCVSLVGPGKGGRRGVPSMVRDSCAGQSELGHLQCTLGTWPVPSCSILEP